MRGRMLGESSYIPIPSDDRATEEGGDVFEERPMLGPLEEAVRDIVLPESVGDL